MDIKQIPLLTNETDLQILRVIISNEHFGINMTDLCKGVGIAHKNLLPHIRKLVDAKLIKIEKQENKRGQEVIVKPLFKMGFGYDQIQLTKQNIFNNKKTKQETLKLVKDLNGKATLEAICYLMKISPRTAWSRIATMLEKGLINMNISLTKFGKRELKELKENEK